MYSNYTKVGWEGGKRIWGVGWEESRVGGLAPKAREKNQDLGESRVGGLAPKAREKFQDW